MKAETIARRRENALKKAEERVVKDKKSYRQAANEQHVPKSTLHDRVKKEKTRPNNWCRTVFTKEEEELLLQTLLHYSNRGVPLTRAHLIEAAEILISTMSPERREKLPFKNGVPGIGFVRRFEKRHKARIKLGNPTKQEAKRYASANADYLTSHFATLRRLIEVHNFDAERIWNLDETGSTPDKEQFGRGRRRRYVRPGRTADARVAEFLNAHRVTILPCISAAGELAPPMFVFKGTLLPYRNALHDGVPVPETYHDHLPRGSLVAMRPEVGGVDSKNFLQWARAFVDSVQYLVKNGRTVLLIYDAYRSHMSLAVLELFAQNNVVVYALPALTSGKTQPLYVVLLEVFKSILRDLLSTLLEPHEYRTYTTWDICRVMREAYYKAFTRENIKASFLRAGVWPLNPSLLQKSPRPASAENLHRLLTPAEMVKMFKKSWRRRGRKFLAKSSS